MKEKQLSEINEARINAMTGFTFGYFNSGEKIHIDEAEHFIRQLIKHYKLTQGE